MSGTDFESRALIIHCNSLSDCSVFWNFSLLLWLNQKSKYHKRAPENQM